MIIHPAILQPPSAGPWKPVVACFALVFALMSVPTAGATVTAAAEDDTSETAVAAADEHEPEGDSERQDAPEAELETDPKLLPELESRSGYEAIPGVGGPTSPTVSLVRADLEKAPAVALPGWSSRLSDHWFSTKQRLFEARGLAFGFSYNLLGQSYHGTERSEATGGIFDATVSWTLTGRESGNTGTLVILAENQHRISSALSPEAAGLAAGSALPTASFSDSGWHLNSLHWSQKIAGEAAILVAGVVDTVDYVDYHNLNDPLTAFSNFAFAGTPTIPLPDPGMGVMFRVATDGLYLSAGLADGNAQAGEPFDRGFFSEREYFSHVEIGATPSFQQRLVENVHLTIWHQDERKALSLPEDWGGALSLSTRLNERTTSFARLALSKGRTTLLDRSVSIGGAYNLRSYDLLGLGLNWSKPSEGSRDQYTLETFYRFQFGPVTTLTPHVQLVWNPALTPERELLTVVGLRARVAL